MSSFYQNHRCHDPNLHIYPPPNMPFPFRQMNRDQPTPCLVGEGQAKHVLGDLRFTSYLNLKGTVCLG
jgi:hypothetical protein